MKSVNHWGVLISYDSQQRDGICTSAKPEVTSLKTLTLEFDKFCKSSPNYVWRNAGFINIGPQRCQILMENALDQN